MSCVVLGLSMGAKCLSVCDDNEIKLKCIIKIFNIMPICYHSENVYLGLIHFFGFWNTCHDFYPEFSIYVKNYCVLNAKE